MFRIPIDDVKLDIKNTELFDKYYEMIRKIGIKELFLDGNFPGLLELSSNRLFEYIPGVCENDDIYYCSEFSLYFKGPDLELIGSRRACFGKNANRKKSIKFFNECQKIIDTNNKITDNYQLLLKR